jgi:DNA-binding NarL/FixJ family response regulator
MRIFLVSALPAVRAGLRALIAGTGGVEVVGEASALDALPSSGAGPFGGADVAVVDAPPDAAVADLAILAADGATAPVVLGPVEGARRLAALLQGRAWAYLSRDASGEALVAAVHAAGAGLTVVDPALATELQLPSGGDADTDDREPTGNGAAPTEPLTPREREVLQLVAAGLPNKQIARRLGISDHTVKFHVAAVLAKLGAGSRTEAVNVGLRRGLVAL